MGLIQNLGSIFKRQPKERGLLFFDTETTDLVPGEIAQLSYLITDKELNILKACNYYFSVEKMSRSASKVNGLTKKKLHILSDGKYFSHHCREIYSDFENKCLIAHNLDFDLKFLNAEYKKLRLARVRYKPNGNICTMKYFTSICKLQDSYGRIKYPKLSELVDFLGIDPDYIYSFASNVFGDLDMRYHDSRYDTVAVYLVFKKARELGYLSRPSV